MEDFGITLAVNSRQIPATVHTRVVDDTTYYDIVSDDFSISIFKDTMYTWKAEDSGGFSADEINSIGEQINNG
ncbi:hypothetical protein HH214_14735 [Mucilaginibacter robiniae]|uniref:Uncharacterized protein n=1 Tax=Mucilaginibacter robiniae TaxID=2728022 RepID=A0A7L5E5I9_9SPHI|nr:hypothetical protein [Mucilaginibacter robiniae]QJD97034.1 hypothetical protein HH214_14735 [Mucilaginibacter robiniae]